MVLTVTFKGKTSDERYRWENVADALPKQIVSVKNSVQADIFPKVNQQYVVRFKRLDGNEMVDPYEISEYYQTCGFWKVDKSEFYFRKGVNKGLTVSQVAAAFPYNKKEEVTFVKMLVALYRKTNNAHTRNNVIRIFNSGLITYCEVFGDDKSSVIQIGTKKGVDITKINGKDYQWARNRLEYYQNKFISPVTYKNCEKWIKYLDIKFAKWNSKN